MQEPIITLLTDFGERDPYVGAMKGVILSICPNIRIVDLSHNIQKHNIREGAFYLFSSVKYYPKNTIHLVVIDPGVGSERKSLIIQSDNYFFVGPDNGVLSLAALEDKVQKVIEINNTAYFLKPVSNTFHGRDIFAPIAAHLAINQTPTHFGSLSQNWIQIKIPQVSVNNDEIVGEIIHIDRFGNIITNISRNFFKKLDASRNYIIEININNQNLKIPLCTSYDQVKIGDFLGIFGSTEFLEISKNQKSAADTLDAQIEEKISVKLLSS
ncbi:MAG: SAM-dependent chlorinase/fluorinase [Candidatus Helarchaeota archaeon]|nr:SAM-dependent chlorinase/fluorinase [Candidatus Helarchaeota archaeon]